MIVRTMVNNQRYVDTQACVCRIRTPNDDEVVLAAQNVCRVVVYLSIDDSYCEEDMKSI